MGTRTQVSPGNNLIGVEGGVIAAVVVIRVGMSDLVPCLCQRAFLGEYRQRFEEIRHGRSED